MPLYMKLLSTAGLAASLYISPVSAQYVGPDSTSSPSNTSSAPQVTTVADILKNPKDDADVTVQGNLLRKVGDEDYVFSDGTGEIVVEIDDDDFPNQRIDETTKVELVGEVDTSRRRPPEIDVDTVRVLQ